RVVGVALSPEFVYAIAPGGLMPDDRRFGILWMGREALTAAFDMEGAFNDVALSLLHGASQDRVIDALDRILKPYGAIAAFGREDQESNWFLMNEIKQLGTTATIMPAIFLTVAAFLCHMVMTRMIATERDEIGLLKAFGYGNAAVGWHYAKLVIVMTMVGVVLGWGLGLVMGRYMTTMYADFFKFPFVFYYMSPGAFALAAGISLVVALLAAMGAVRAAVALSPAEAMRPPSPTLFRRAGGVAAVLGRVLDQPTRIILRQIVRWPVRAAMSSIGIALAVGLLITSMQWVDAINRLVDVYFAQAQRQNISVGLADIRPASAVGEMARLPGVRAAEGARFVSVRLRANGVSRREAIIGISENATLNPIFDATSGIVRVPEDGLILSRSLAEILGVSVGDPVTVEVLVGRQPTLVLPMAGVFDTDIATPLYMNIRALNRAMHEAPVVNVVHLLTDPEREGELFAALKNMPQVSAVTIKQQAIDVFHKTMGETMLIFVSFFVVFACFLVIGVVYNSARISLSERGRELATMRVLGFSRADVSYILLGEVGLITFVAMPLGCLTGRLLVWLIADSFDTEMFRVPPVIEPSTYGLSLLFALGAAVVSAAIVRRAVDRLDMIAVLKTWE
ncbi:MAG: ABC transporter permease, partial [Rhodospirillales bacterium]|nr:ABC transporter permease [Rhodospirillales bacterium]